jgi:aminoglycoside 3-N-acetyltransferase
MKKIISNMVTKTQLVSELRELGVKHKMVIEVHVAMSSFEYIVGGAQTVIDSLIEIVGYEGTLIMAMHAGGNGEPADWAHPPIEYDLMQSFRENMPAFDKKETDTRGMGKVLENFRRRDGICVSSHPTLAYIAWGKYAKLLCNHQSLNFPLAEESPTARLYELKAYCLLLGVDYDNATCLHLAEYRSNTRPVKVFGTSVMFNNKKSWMKYLDLDLDSEDFIKGMKRYEKDNYLAERTINGAECKLFRIDQSVDYLSRYLERKLSKYMNL